MADHKGLKGERPVETGQVRRESSALLRCAGTSRTYCCVYHTENQDLQSTCGAISHRIVVPYTYRACSNRLVQQYIAVYHPFPFFSSFFVLFFGWGERRNRVHLATQQRVHSFFQREMSQTDWPALIVTLLCKNTARVYPLFLISAQQGENERRPINLTHFTLKERVRVHPLFLHNRVK